jgi:hypothetical protein
MTGAQLRTQPGPGGRVRDGHGRVWVNTAGAGGYAERGSNWELEEAVARGSFEPESWTRVCEFGPVTDVADRWTALREEITRDAATEQGLGDDYGDMGTGPSWDSANKHWGKAEALREVLATMDRMEAGR